MKKPTERATGNAGGEETPPLGPPTLAPSTLGPPLNPIGPLTPVVLIQCDCDCIPCQEARCVACVGTEPCGAVVPDEFYAMAEHLGDLRARGEI